MRNLLIAASAIALLGAGSAFAGDINTGTNGFQQNNNALQLSVTGINAVSVGGSLSGEAASVGNSLSLNAVGGKLTVSNDVHQKNSGTEVAAFIANDSNIAYGSIDAKALGNTATYSATTSVSGAGEQLNSGTQLSGVGLINVNSGNLETSAVAVGNATTVSAGTFEVYGAGFDRQVNSGLQVAVNYTTDSTIGGTFDSLAQAAGNSLSVNTSGNSTLQWSQNNSGPQLALNIVTDSFVGNDASISSVAAGNLINASSASVGQTAFFQTNTAPQIAATYVGNTSFNAGLNVGSTAIGNGVTVKTF